VNIINLPGVAAFKYKPPSPPRRTQRPSQWRHYEADQQRILAELLTRLIVPGTCFWTAIENKPRSAISGVYQKLAGVRSGFPDLIFLRADRPPIFIEMKSPVGRLGKPQRQIRSELVAQGCKWFLCRSASSALVALRRAGVAFRPDAWQPPELEPWEEPVENPTERHPRHPSLTAKRREAKRRQRAKAKPAAAEQRDHIEQRAMVFLGTDWEPRAIKRVLRQRPRTGKPFTGTELSDEEAAFRQRSRT
jgi:hypothetical protein